MAGIEITRVDLSAVALRSASARAPDARPARRMLALALALAGVDRETAAETCGMDRQTLRVDLQRVIERRFGVVMHERTVGKQLRALGFVKLTARGGSRQTYRDLPGRSKGRPAGRADPSLGKARNPAPRAARPALQMGLHPSGQARGQAFGSVRPARAATAGLVLPRANADMLSLHLAEIATQVEPDAHAVLVLDGAGWHVAHDLAVPTNISLLVPPPYAPELNPVENVWQRLRQNKLANTVFEDAADIVDQCSRAGASSPTTSPP